MRYLIGLAARTFDPEGALLVPWRADTQSENLSRRVTRVKTLDLGVAITDRGYTPGDRTVVLSLLGEPKKTVERARRLLRLHSNVTISLNDGCFAARMSSYDERRKEITVLITGVA